MDLVKECSHWSMRTLASARASSSGALCEAPAAPAGSPTLADYSVKDLVARGLHLVGREVWNRDHPISAEGIRQTQVLRGKIAARRLQASAPAGCPTPSAGDPAALPPGAVAEPGLSSTPSSSSFRGEAHCAEGLATAAERTRVQRYYDSFLSEKQQIYCSPLLRALQTAQLALPEEDGWGSIILLKDARERFRFLFERDCLGMGVGTSIADRAVAQLQMDVPDDSQAMRRSVDATDCAQKWWSDEPETDEQVEARLKSLWKKLLVDDTADSCVLVTHSNLIKALIMQFGVVEEENDGASHRMEGLRASENPGASRGDATAPEHGAPSKCGGMYDSAEDEQEEEEEEEEEDVGSWQVVPDAPQVLRELKVGRLQNCGVLGLRCVLESPAQEAADVEVDGGWVDIEAYLRPRPQGDDTSAGGIDSAADDCAWSSGGGDWDRCGDVELGCGRDAAAIGARCGEAQWVAKDALLMFDSVLVQ